MKKASRLIALALILVTLVAVLASCNPSGKYYAKVLGVTSESVYIEFKGNKVNATIVGMTFTGATYKIKNDKISFTYSDDKGNSITTPEVSFKQDGKVITIAGVTYEKK